MSIEEDKCIDNIFKELENALKWHMPEDKATYKIDLIKKIVYE